MKSLYDSMPESFIVWDNGTTLVNYDIVEVTKEMGEDVVISYECESVLVTGEPTYPKVIEALIRNEYTISDEIAILRQREEKREEFARYNGYVELCKSKAKALFGICD